MDLTKEKLIAMNENDLRTKVLIPLFRAMEYKDVIDYHGPNELGKDIVMWKPEGIRDRVNYGVVVKAKIISGKTLDIGDVVTQIKQCLSTTYLCKITNEEKPINRCFFVSSHDITPEFRDKAKGIINDDKLINLVDFIDGEKLWELIRKHLPEATIMTHAEIIKSNLKNFNNLSPEIVVNKNETKIILNPKLNEDGTPITVASCQIIFPNTPEGNKLFTSFEDFRKKGTPFTITKPFIKDFSIHDELLKLIDDRNIEKLELSSAKAPLLSNVKISVIRKKALKASLENIELSVDRSGTEEILLSNKSQKYPLQVEAIFNKKKKVISFHFSINPFNYNVKQVLESEKFYSEMVKGGILRMENIETGLDFVNSQISKIETKETSKQGLKLLEKLLFIQKKTNIPIIVPSEDITREDVEYIYEIAEILEKGKITLRKASLNFNILPCGVDFWINSAKDEMANPLVMTRTTSYNVLGINIPIGPTKISCDKMYIPEIQYNQLLEQVKEGLEVYEIQLIPFENTPVIAEYEKWMK